MFIRLIYYYLLCAGILQICAFPAPQNSTDDFGIYSTQENVAIEDPIKDDLPVAQAERDEKVVTEMRQDSTEPISNTNKVSNSNYSIVEAQEASNDNHEGSENEAPKTCILGETANNGANKELNDTKTVKPDSVDSKNDSDDHGFTEISHIDVFGRHLRLKEKDVGDAKILCQELTRSYGEVIAEHCVTVTSPHIIFDNEKMIDDLYGSGEDKYKCQVILDTSSESIIQQLCVTYDGRVLNPIYNFPIP